MEDILLAEITYCIEFINNNRFLLSTFQPEALDRDNLWKLHDQLYTYAERWNDAYRFLLFFLAYHGLDILIPMFKTIDKRLIWNQPKIAIDIMDIVLSEEDLVHKIILIEKELCSYIKDRNHPVVIDYMRWLGKIRSLN